MILRRGPSTRKHLADLDDAFLVGRDRLLLNDGVSMPGRRTIITFNDLLQQGVEIVPVVTKLLRVKD